MVAALKIGAAEAGVVGHWLDGKHVSGAGQRRAPVFNPALGEPVREVAFAGDVLPQKSTDFFPKLLSGLAIYALD